MTTTTRRRPLPSDMPAMARRLIEPAIVPAGHPYRDVYERGVRSSRMHPHTRLVALTLATHADHQRGHIAEDAQPYLAGLTAETGLHEGQVAVAITTLITRGWVRRAPEAARRERYDTAPLQLCIPRVLLGRLLKQ